MEERNQEMAIVQKELKEDVEIDRAQAKESNEEILQLLRQQMSAKGSHPITQREDQTEIEQ